MLPDWEWSEWILATVFLLGSYLGAGIIYGVLGSKIWGIRGDRGQYDSVLNRIYTKSPIKRDIMYIHGSTERFQKECSERFSSIENRFTLIEGKVSTIYDSVFSWQEKLTRLEEKTSSLLEKIDDNLPLDIDGISQKTFDKLKGLKGQQMRLANAEMKELIEDVGEVTSIEYPALIEVAGKVDNLVELGIIDEGYAQKFLKIASNPETQPYAEKAAKRILDLLDNGGTTGRSHHKSSNWI